MSDGFVYYVIVAYSKIKWTGLPIMKKILYVDDEPLLLTLVRKFMEKKGFLVDTAESAVSALELMEADSYDAVISDYQMPGMSGIEFLRAIRDSGDQTPFIIFTGRGREEVVIQAFDNGADFYIQKGGDPNAQFVELTHKINQAITLRHTEEALRDSEEKYRLLVEKANEAILIAQDLRVKFANLRFSSLLSIPMDYLIGKPISEIVYPDDHELVLSRYDQRIAGEDVPEKYEFRIVDSSGNIHWVKIHATKIVWEKKPALLILLDDITPRKAAQEELSISNRKLEELNEELKIHFKAIAERNDELQGAYEQLKAAEDELRRNYVELEEKECLLRESEEKFRRIVENADGGIWEMDALERTTFVNNKMAEMMGYTSGEMIGRELISFIPPEELKDHRGLIERRRTGVSAHYVRRFMRKDGIFRWMKVRATPLMDKEGNFSGSFAMVSDITEQKIAEDALKESWQRMMDIIDFLPDATMVIDTDGKVIAWNRAMEEMTWVKASDIVGRGDYEYALPFYKERRPLLANLVLDYDPDVASKYPFVKREGNRLVSEITIPHFNEGKGADMWFISTPLYDSEGNITGAIESIRDISDKKKSEEALLKKNEELGSAYEQLAAMDEEIRGGFEELEKSHVILEESEERYRDLIENAPVGIFTGTSGGRFLSINKAGAKILGFSSSEEVTDAFTGMESSFKCDKDQGHLLRNILRAKGFVEDFALEFTTPGGSKRHWINVSARVSKRDDDGSFIVQGFFTDISDLSGFSDALEKANQELKLLTRITRHDILNNVMAAYCYIELLKEPDDPDRDNYITIIHEILQKIQKQIEFTKKFENIGSRPPEWQSLQGILERIAGSSPVPVRMNGCGVELFADPVLMKVFDNLLDNTFRHGGEDITGIEVSCKRSEDGGFMVVFEDDGPGIPVTDKELIFDRGFGKNTGLGLFLVKEILGISGITIRECGIPGEGARFEILVPEGKYRIPSNLTERDL